MLLRGFYFITDRVLSKDGLVNDVRQAINSGVCAVQYRDKNIDTRLMLETALLLKKISKGVPLIINDRIDIALAVDAAGVHLGQDDMPVTITRKILGKGKIIGLTVSSLTQAEKGVKAGVDYLGVAPVFSTTTKADAGRPVGLRLISQIRKKFKSIPLVGIGGINLKNAQSVIATGADALCAISAVVNKGDVSAQIKSFIEKINIGLSLRRML